jgi:2-desacetyl-2-hydroxyethyl bacteriochlorophyllide A dehydrogenase
VFRAPRRVSVETTEVREPGPGQALIRTEYSGISSGTEMLAYRGRLDPAMPVDETLGTLGGTFAYPFAFGYSCVGVVDGSESTARAGERVFAFHPHQDAFTIDEADAIPMGSADPRGATLLPLVETGLQVSLDAGARFGETVVVVGLGAVGVLVGAVLARSGVDVIGVDPEATRRDLADGFGLHAVGPDGARDAVMRATGGRGVGMVIEASGNAGALADALPLLAHEGTALVCSWYGTEPVPLPLGAEFHRRRLTIRSSQVSTIPAALQPTWDRARRRAEARRLLDELPVKLLATHEFPFERAPEAYAAIDRGEPGLIHAALRYR